LTAKILVVDDEEPIRSLAQMILTREGYDVVTASNGVEAIQKAEVEKPDLVLLDVVMPGMSGLEVCSVLKTETIARFVPVVMFTVLGRDVDHRLAEESGCDGYFVKPFTPEDLLAEVKMRLKESEQKNPFKQPKTRRRA